MSRIIVTGALGHIGSSLIRRLPEFFPETPIVLIDHLVTQRYVSLFNLSEGGSYRFIEADILEFPFETFLEPGDSVVHLAALTVPHESVLNPEATYRVNFYGTCRLARACAARGARMLFFSTTSLYTEHCVTETAPFQDLQALNPYAQSKLKAEMFLRSWGNEQGLEFMTFRFGTIFGVSPGMRFHTAVNRFCWQASVKNPLSIWRTAMDQKRPYLDLKDAVRVIIFALQGNLESGGTYNALTGNYTVREILDILQREIPDVVFELVDSPLMSSFSTEVSADLLTAAGFEFKGSLEEGIRETLGLLKKVSGRQAEIPLSFS